MKELPKLYKNKNPITIDNNKKVCYLKTEQINQVKEELNLIGNDLKKLYNDNIKVFIKTKKKTYETSIIIKTKKYIITIDDETIPIEDIIYIKRIP